MKSSMKYSCCDTRRRDVIKALGETSPVNGIDFIEVEDTPESGGDRQRVLWVHFIHPLQPPTQPLESISNADIRITGGDRIQNIIVTALAWVEIEQTTEEPEPGTDPSDATDATPTATNTHLLKVTVNQLGDFSTYTLELTNAGTGLWQSFDRQLSKVDFSFKINCPDNFDCKAAPYCPPEVSTEPNIDYLAKDYASFRQLMLDRLSVLMPDWEERHPADLGMTLVELLAYVGDQLSYKQDAIATESYLGTARLRTSIRRHARLMDYFMHDGCNARTWVQIQLAQGAADDVPITIPKGVQLLSEIPNESKRLKKLPEPLPKNVLVFETMHEETLFPQHQEMTFHTWGDQQCCLPKGATRATLEGNYKHLKAGMVLIFQEMKSSRTGDADDADFSHRHAVRLTHVAFQQDPIGQLFKANDEPSRDNLALDVTEITWHSEDALPFSLCLSAETDAAFNRGFVDHVSVALGNIVLADHGRTIQAEPLGRVPQSQAVQVLPDTLTEKANGTLSDRTCRTNREERSPVKFRPTLKESPITQASPFTADTAQSASRAISQQSNLQQTLPSGLRLWSKRKETIEDTWTPQKDLLQSDSRPEFVVEIGNDHRATLRFGQGQYGKQPVPGTDFTATYRVGNGPEGNIGANALSHIISTVSEQAPATPTITSTEKSVAVVLNEAIVGVTNPLPARGGKSPESIETVRQKVPGAFRRPARAVTPADYAQVITQNAAVQRGVATLRWTGSWHTVFVSADPKAGASLTRATEASLRRELERYRMAGHDVEIDPPRFVPLSIAMRVRLRADVFRRDVRDALSQLFSNRLLPDGSRGVFHPDNFTFGQVVYLSPLYAAAQAVDGVIAVEVTRFQRQDFPSDEALATGRLVLERLEIARLDNDPNFRDRGSFELTLEGGK